MAPMMTEAILELNPRDLGTLELGDQWVPYVDLYEEDFLPTRIKLGADEYAWHSSTIVRGHSAELPAKIRELRSSGKKPIIIERANRYYVFVSPP